MSTDRETTRLVRSWLEEGATALPDRVLDAVLDQVPATPQRRSWWPTRRIAYMNKYVLAAIAAAAVLVAAVVGYNLLPRSGGVGGQPSIAPSPSPAPLARGTFGAKGGTVKLDATGDGDNVTGTMTVSHETGDFTVDLKCGRTADDGRILIGGDTTDSASSFATKGARTAIVLKPGSPVHAVFFFEDNPAAASCLAFLDGVIDEPAATVIGDGALEPITGTVELRS